MTSQPLTAELQARLADSTEIANAVYDQIMEEQGKRDEEYLLEDIEQKLLEFAEAYAAQQNAELVAENERLKLENYEFIEGGEDLQAENERLKQQLADLVASDCPI